RFAPRGTAARAVLRDVEGSTRARSSVDRRQLGHRQREPLHAVAAEVDLRAGLLAGAFERDDHALAELGGEHRLALARLVAVARRGAAFLHRPGHRRAGHAAGTHHRAQARAALPGRLVLARIARAEGLVARREPAQVGLGQLVDEAALDVVARLAVQQPR